MNDIQKVIVTGGAGFIGSYVVEGLVKRGYEVTVADNLSKPESSIPKGARFVRADLTNPKETMLAFKNQEICINMASKIGGIGYFHKYPGTIVSENCKIYSSTFEAAAKNKIKRMVYLSSSMVFECAKKFPSKEEDILDIPPPLSGYGFSKLAGEYYCKTFKEEFGLNYTIIRPFNAYGINESPGEYIGYAHVIPDIIKKILSGQYPLEILGDGQQTRSFTHVKDVADAIILAMESKKAENEDFNIGSEKETKIISLAQSLWKLCGKEEQFMAKFIPGFKHDIKKRVPLSAKAEKLLGWKPKIQLEEGLKEIVGWMMAKKRK